MVSILVFLVIIIFVVVVAGGLVWAVREEYKNAGQKEMPQLMQEQAKEKAEHLQEIKDLAAGKNKITNDDIQKLLGVSDATAVRYLDELEKEGALKQVGKTGKYTYYSKV